jgi:8-oxo-dGTP pyrophosphatase MutT (NUDIX family)
MPDTSHRPAHRFPVSIKGVCVRDEQVLLLLNERGEWELPGGKLEVGERPEDCLAREIEEETGWPVRVGDLIDCWQYHIFEGVDVVIVTYGCTVLTDAEPQVSLEHKVAKLVALTDVASLPMPCGYKHSIRAWASARPESLHH